MDRGPKTIVLGLLALSTLSGCGRAGADAPQLVQVEADVYTLPGGETLSTWQYPKDSRLLYLLDDGTELLAATAIRGPADAVVGGGEQVQTLEQTVQDKIAGFYQQQGALYDLGEYLEKAYAEYTSEETGPGFQAYTLSQDTAPGGSNDTVFYCTTELLLPFGPGLYDVYYLTQAFDKKSGDPIDPWDLFCAAQEEVKTALLSDDTMDTEALEVLGADFRPEYVRFYPNGYSVRFPCGTSLRLPREESSSPANIEIGGEYTDQVLSVLNAWAIPADRDEAAPS